MTSGNQYQSQPQRQLDPLTAGRNTLVVSDAQIRQRLSASLSEDSVPIENRAIRAGCIIASLF